MKSKLAIICFILGIISILFPFSFRIIITQNPFEFLIFIFGLTILISIAGLITGTISLFFIRKYKLDGVWYSILGIIFSLIGLFEIFLFVIGVGQASGSFL